MGRKRATQSVDEAVIKDNASCAEIEIFAKTLNTLLEDKGKHQSDLERETGIGSGTISAYRNGKQAPGLVNLIKIARCLDVDCHYLATGIEAKHYAIASELGLSDIAIHELKALQNGPIFTETINNFISSDCFRQIIAFAYHFRKAMADIVNMSEDPAIEPSDIGQKFSSADLFEYHASKNLSSYFDGIKEDELSKSSTLTKTSNGYQLHLESRDKQDGKGEVTSGQHQTE